MNQEVAGKTLRKLRVLVAPLDWGLGHATRCIPVIHELLNIGCEPVLAAEGAQAALLRMEFPDLLIIPLEGYRINYGRTGFGTIVKMIFHSGRIMEAIKKENEWLKKAVNKYSLDAILSDNRFGLYHESVPSIFITHQLRIKSPFGNFSESFLQRRNYRYINRFTECWVPDFENDQNLAGELSHPLKKPRIPVRYVGPLSRFRMMKKENENKQKILVILSGPEPQRSILENKVVSDISNFNGEATIVRGLPDNERLIPSTNTIHFYNHLSSKELSREMNEASIVISRSGYSTVMDIMEMGKKSVLVPTPGQTEQEYLAKHLSNKGLAPFLSQSNFSLERAVALSLEYKYFLGDVQNDDLVLQKELRRFIAGISK
jgi:uncharacterized protein (TIGR00661 family)